MGQLYYRGGVMASAILQKYGNKSGYALQLTQLWMSLFTSLAGGSQVDF
jgi:hypothetical protein